EQGIYGSWNLVVFIKFKGSLLGLIHCRDRRKGCTKPNAPSPGPFPSDGRGGIVAAPVAESRGFISNAHLNAAKNFLSGQPRQFIEFLRDRLKTIAFC